MSLTFLNVLVKEKQQHKNWLWLNAGCDKFVPTFKNFSIKFEWMVVFIGSVGDKITYNDKTHVFGECKY